MKRQQSRQEQVRGTVRGLWVRHGCHHVAAIVLIGLVSGCDLVPPSVGGVSGTVVDDETQAPVANVRVMFGRRSTDLRYGARSFASLALPSVTTNEAGEFRADGLETGKYEIAIDHTIYKGLVSEVRFEVKRDEVTEDVRVVVLRGGVISGRVFARETGEGIKGLEFELEGGGSSSQKVQTDENGEYMVEGLAAGGYEMSPPKVPGYRLLTRTAAGKMGRITVSVRLVEELLNMDLVYTKNVEVAGTVVDAEGQPVADAQVKAIVLSSYYDTVGHRELAGRTGPDGTFGISGFSLGDELAIKVTRNRVNLDLSSDLSETHVDEDGINNVVLKVGKAAVAKASASRGRVDGPDGRAISGAGVRLRVGPGSQLDVSAPVRETAGSAAERLPLTETKEGARKVATASSGAEKARRQGDGPVPAVGEKISISGHVYDDEKRPLAGARVHVSRSMSNDVITDENGAYTFEGLSNGRYGIDAKYSDDTGTLLGRGSWRPGAENTNIYTSWVIRRTDKRQLFATVLDAETEEPVQHFQYAMWKPFEDAHVSDGTFRLPFEVVRTYAVRVKARGYATQVLDVEIPLGGEGDITHTFLMEPAAIVKGRTVDAEGKPVGGALVVPNPSENTPAFRARDAVMVTRPDGTFYIDSLVPGTARLGFVHTDYMQNNITIEPRAGEEILLEVPLYKGGVIEGLVTSGGHPLDKCDASITCRDSSGEWLRSGVSGEITMRDGHYQIRRLTPGEVVVEVSYSFKDDDGPYSSSVHYAKNVVIEDPDGVVPLDFDYWVGTSTLEGVIELDGELVDWASVTVDVETGDGVISSTTVDVKNGRFTMERLSAGPATVTVTAGDGTTGDKFARYRDPQRREELRKMFTPERKARMPDVYVAYEMTEPVDIEDGTVTEHTFSISKEHATKKLTRRYFQNGVETATRSRR